MFHLMNLDSNYPCGNPPSAVIFREKKNRVYMIIMVNMQRPKYFKFLTRNRMEDLFCYKITKKKMYIRETGHNGFFYIEQNRHLYAYSTKRFFFLPPPPLYIYIHSKLSRNVISKSCSIFSFINCIIFLIKVQ